jgi:hypothetical protein
MMKQRISYALRQKIIRSSCIYDNISIFASDKVVVAVDREVVHFDGPEASLLGIDTMKLHFLAFFRKFL